MLRIRKITSRSLRGIESLSMVHIEKVYFNEGLKVFAFEIMYVISI